MAIVGHWSDAWHITSTLTRDGKEVKRETSLTALLQKLGDGKVPPKPTAETWEVQALLDTLLVTFKADRVEASFNGNPLLAAERAKVPIAEAMPRANPYRLEMSKDLRATWHVISTYETGAEAEAERDRLTVETVGCIYRVVGPAEYRGP